MHEETKKTLYSSNLWTNIVTVLEENKYLVSPN